MAAVSIACNVADDANKMRLVSATSFLPADFTVSGGSSSPSGAQFTTAPIGHFFYNKEIDVTNGFEATFDVKVNMPSGQSADVNSPFFSLVVGRGLPSEGGKAATVSISAAGQSSYTDSTGASESGTESGDFSSTTKIILQYSASTDADTGRFLKLFYGDSTGTAVLTVDDLDLTSQLDGDTGFLGLTTTVTPFVSNPWSSLQLSGFHVDVIRADPATSSFLGADDARTVEAGSEETYTLNVMDKCGQSVHTETASHGFEAVLVDANGVERGEGVISLNENAFAVVFNPTVAGVMDMHVTYDGEAVGGSPFAASLTVNTGAIDGSSAEARGQLKRDVTPVGVECPGGDGCVDIFIDSTDAYGNKVDTEVPDYFSASWTDVSNPNAGATPIEVVWDVEDKVYDLSFNITDNGFYSVEITYEDPDSGKAMNIVGSPYSLELVTKGENTIVDKLDWTLIIMVSVSLAIIVLVCIYGIWRGNRYRTKHRQKKKWDKGRLET